MTPALDTSRQAKVVAQAQAVLSQHAKSFQLASLFLPKEKAADAAILYQFCRLVDDACMNQSDRSLKFVTSMTLAVRISY